MPAVHFKVEGLVHGVFFRTEAQKKAQELGLAGWVKNCDDGSVEIHAEGPADKLKELEQWCWRGPERAKVHDVVSESISEEGCTVFTIR